ncbi:YqeG family HAD IIIA-type phosphatase [Lusitaniella coriacea LEGE 07157]|uniref:YqeG family HAD IIIA-type phosphatase n=1 Tax=Lusitaniella coriacea LEGE 07157 TaxID=945747 RepID=A0A8J7DWU2_9CYAN|nr:YqeG family HAD IIIA-type phosphatase [Lusitaniella coriacea]MBE9116547.1 YqeG family HAD IIIA-type phosphatase [Lusitaniella coriacea LEGE 07157]
MSWEARLQPNLVLGGPITNLTPDLLKQYRLKGLVLDVDETLVPLREREVSQEVQVWIQEIRSCASLWLVSNNLSENRIGGIAKSLDLPYILGARKPSRRKLRQAVEEMNLPFKQVAMVGDRLFTDVWAGNRLGMFSILVEPMIDPAIAPKFYALRNFEVLISQWLGVSIAGQQQNLK